MANTPNDLLVLRALQEIPSTASHAAKDEMIKTLQTTVNHLQDRITELEDEKAALEEMLDDVDPKWRSKEDLPPLLRDVKNIAEIRRLGRTFGFLYYPFLEKWAFLRPCPTRPSPTERYSTRDNIEDAIVCDLFDFIPAKYHDVMENHSEFGAIFVKALRGCRGSMIKLLRDRGMTIITGLKPEYFRASFAGRGTIAQLANLVGYDPKTPEYLPLWPPVIYGKNSDGKPDDQKCFQGEILPSMLSCMLFGIAALTPDQKQDPTRKTYGELWRLSEVTPGCIAFVSILAIILLSPDTTFAEKGNNTKVKYVDHFNTYMQVLTAGADYPAIKDTFKFFNTNVFSHGRSHISASHTSTSHAGTASADSVLARLASSSLALSSPSSSTVLLSVDPDNSTTPEDTGSVSSREPASALLAHVEPPSVTSPVHEPAPTTRATRGAQSAARARGARARGRGNLTRGSSSRRLRTRQRAHQSEDEGAVDEDL